MVAKNVQLKQVLWVYLLCCWATAVCASDADLTFVQGIETVPFKAIGYVFGLSILGGMAGTLPKIVSPTIQIKNVWLEMLKDMVCSIAAGLIIFLAAQELKWSWSLTCLLVILGGAGNTKFIDLLLNNGFFPRVAQFFGKMPVGMPLPPADPQPPTEN